MAVRSGQSVTCDFHLVLNILQQVDLRTTEESLLMSTMMALLQVVSSPAAVAGPCPA